MLEGALFFALIAPAAILAVVSYHRSHRDLTELTYSRRHAVASLAATLAHERLDNAAELATSLATRVAFRDLIGQGRWEDAVRILVSVPQDFPFIERVFLADPGGTLTADTPALPGVRGMNFAFRDWYQGVSRSWEPYVSRVYQRMAEPRNNVIAVAAPIRAAEGRLLGILVLQIRLETIMRWAKEIQPPSPAVAFFTDQDGRIAAHPEFSAQGDFVDYSGVPAVARALRGESGVQVMANPLAGQDELSAFAPVEGYGWAAVVSEPARAAFETRSAALRRTAVVFGMLLGLNVLFAVLVMRLNARLRRRGRELAALNEELEAFTYSASHDLRAPLRAIDGFSAALLEDCMDTLDERGRDYLNRVRGAAQRMGALIDDFLVLSRVTRATLRRERVDLSAQAKEIAEELRRQDPGREVDLQIQPGLIAEGDAKLLRIALENLLGNAWKFTSKRPRARIEVGLGAREGQPAYFVRDNGVGFDMTYARKLFGAFQRLHPAQEFPGTGIGLATVRRIIHRHGGMVWADAAPDLGATFFFTV